jgi:hypothetical protein
VPVPPRSLANVGAYLGAPRFTNTGFTLNASGLSPGIWRLVVFTHSTVSGTFTSGQPFVVEITVH